MLLKALPLLLTIGTALAMNPKIRADRTLLDFMIDSNRAGTTNPALQQYCFNRYLPILKGITDDYERDYGICADNYRLGCSKIDEGFTGAYDNVTNIARATCTELKKCDSYERYVEAFDCYSSTGSDQAKELLSMSGFADENAVDIRNSYRTVDSAAQACVSRAEKTYWDNTINTQAELTKCLASDMQESSTKAPLTMRGSLFFGVFPKHVAKSMTLKPL